MAVRVLGVLGVFALFVHVVNVVTTGGIWWLLRSAPYLWLIVLLPFVMVAAMFIPEGRPIRVRVDVHHHHRHSVEHTHRIEATAHAAARVARGIEQARPTALPPGRGRVIEGAVVDDPAGEEETWRAEQ